MANTIKQKRGTSDPEASDLVVGELAINTTDGGVFTKTDGGSVVEVGSGGGGGAHTLISTSNITSSTANVSFTGLTGYKNYKVLFTTHCGSANVHMRVGVDGTYDTGNNYKVGGGTATGQFKFSGFNMNAMVGQVNLFDLNEALSTKISTLIIGESNDLTAYNSIGNQGGHTTTSAQNCVQFFLSSGNFTRATFSIYGAL